MQERGSILDLDFNRANAFPDDYDTDLELEWGKECKFSFFIKIILFIHIIYLDLFANGDDFSWETIQKGRNNYYQKQAVRKRMISFH